jgi:hypothetical protein
MVAHQASFAIRWYLDRLIAKCGEGNVRQAGFEISHGCLKAGVLPFLEHVKKDVRATTLRAIRRLMKTDIPFSLVFIVLTVARHDVHVLAV